MRVSVRRGGLTAEQNRGPYVHKTISADLLGNVSVTRKISKCRKFSMNETTPLGAVTD